MSKKLSRYVTDEDEAGYDLQYSASGGDESPPPPPPPKHITPNKTYGYVKDDHFNKPTPRVPFDADDFRISTNSQGVIDEEAYLKLSLKQEELKNSIKSLQSDVLNLSELSATSAGSFLRHKYEKDLQASQLGLSHISVEERHEENQTKHQMLWKLFSKTKPKQSNIFKNC